ncbi:MAG TPA: helix-hairpin-helix domain-containing protein [Pyrinomonadaceae bacterium]
MGFFDRFSKTFLGKKEAEEVPPPAHPTPYSTLSIYSPELTTAKVSTELEKGANDGTVAVAEMSALETEMVHESSNNGAVATSDYFDADFEQDLDAVFASLENRPAETVVVTEPADEDMNADDQKIVEQLFADIAANYARPIKNFMFELKRGTATKDWVEICRPAMQGITRAAEGMGLRQAAQRMMDFEAALSLAAQNEQRVLGGEVRDLLMWCYDDLVKVMPQAFVVGEEEQQREGIIINSLLAQIPDVGRVTIEKLYRAGLTSLDTLYLARREELAVATGISIELSERICAKFQAYRAGLEASNRDVKDVGQRNRLSEFVTELKRQHEGYVRASEDPKATIEKRDFREQRQACVLWINVLLAEVGEIDLVTELQKMSFERRIQRLEEYLASNSA